MSYFIGTGLIVFLFVFVEPLWAQRLYETSSQRYGNSSVVSPGMSAMQSPNTFYSTSPLRGSQPMNKTAQSYSRYEVRLNAIGAQHAQDVRVRRSTGRPHDDEGGEGTDNGNTDPGNVGNQDPNYPIGGSMSLLFFAFAYAVAVCMRSRRRCMS